MRAILTLAWKDLTLFSRDRFALFWVFAFPLMFALFFGVIFGNEDDGRGAIAISIVDEDGSSASRALLERLAAGDSVKLTRVGEGPEAPIETLDLAAAREAVQKGKRTAYLRIPHGFGDNPYAVFGAGDGTQAPLEIGIDPGRRAEAGMLQGVLMESVFGALRERFTNKEALRGDLDSAREGVAAAEDLSGAQKLVLQAFFGALDSFVERFDLEALEAKGTGADGAKGGLQPFEVVDVSRDQKNRPRSTFDITFPQALVWGLLSVSLSFAITLVRERSSGTLLRLRMAPISRTQLLAGKALGCFIGCLLTMFFLMAFGSLALGMHVDSLPLLLLGMICVAGCFTGVMMTVSVLGKTEAAVAGASWGVMMPFAMIGGGMIPLIAMPEWLVSVSVISPFRWAITAVEGAVWRGFELTDMLLPCGVLLAIGALFFTLGVAIFRKLDG